jgi:hypothetical protein
MPLGECRLAWDLGSGTISNDPQSPKNDNILEIEAQNLCNRNFDTLNFKKVGEACIAGKFESVGNRLNE